MSHDDIIADEMLDAIMNTRVLFGLRSQGHLATVAAMLKDGKPWIEIGRAIGWCPRAAQEFYEKESKHGPEVTR